MEVIERDRCICVFWKEVYCTDIGKKNTKVGWVFENGGKGHYQSKPRLSLLQSDHPRPMDRCSL